MIYYTDGGYCMKQKEGAYGWVKLRDDEIVSENFTKIENSTTNVAELSAVLEVLKDIHKNNHKGVIIFTDSKYCQKGCSEWIYNWVRNGWQGSRGEIKNVELWKEVWNIMTKIKFVIYHVKGHSGDKWNEYVDTNVWNLYKENQKEWKF